MVAGSLVEVLGDNLTINIVSFPLLPFAELLVRTRLDTNNGLIGHSAVRVFLALKSSSNCFLQNFLHFL